MKINLLICTICFLGLMSCGSDDDICVSGEATPQMKLKFKTTDNKLYTVDSLFISVNYSTSVKRVATLANADSVLIPLRVDNSTYTDFYVKTRIYGDSSKIRVNYTAESQYVSPACGFKKTYTDTSYTLEKANPVVNLEPNQTEITNEDNAHLYLIF
ncbi:MAG: DUF6452 family protein [Cruoricaptor ignavus]|nr:DUF6452 family protein [Cruoricaptor ignavus]